MGNQPKANAWEGIQSGIADSLSAISTFYDTTSVQIFAAANVDTGTTDTGTFVDCSRYNSVMLWIDSSSVTTVAASMTGLEVSFYTRPVSGAAFAQFALQSGIAAEAASLLKVRGTGLTASGILPLGDLKVLVTNRSGSATATLNAYLMLKGT